MFKKASSSEDLSTTESIMGRIYREEPSYWPYGLARDQFDPGGLYLISKAAGAEPVGFVGWQSRQEGDRKVGYYAIGVLPEHREQGFAKQAVAQVLRCKSGEVDEVRALIAAHNAPSKSLAASLSIPVIEKVAMTGGAAKALKGWARTRHNAGTAGALGLGAAGTVAFYDQANDASRTVDSTLDPSGWDKERSLIGGLNAAIGASAGYAAARHGKAGILSSLGAFALAPAKDALIKGQSTMHKIDNVSESLVDYIDARKKDEANAAPALPESNLWDKIPKGLLLGAGGLGLGALAIAAYKAKKNSDNQEKAIAESGKGRVRVTLPTKNPGDVETQLEIPIEEINLSNALRGRIGRDTRRRLLSETKARTKTRKPEDPDNPNEREEEDLDIDREHQQLSKVASFKNGVETIYAEKAGMAPPPPPNTGVPTPPIPGQNPAMRQATANSMPPSTGANPQIMKAEQAATEAQQQGAQQAAAMEQQSQQAQMEQQQKFQMELGKKTQENEILKIQMERQKAEADLAKQKGELSAEASGGEATAVQRLTSSRLDRLHKRVKSASPAAPAPGLAPTPGIKVLKPGAGQRVNDSPMVTKLFASPGAYRTSYGKMGDWIYDTLFRTGAMAPKAQPSTLPRGPGMMGSAMTAVDVMNSPDQLRALSSLYAR